jgi:hypothetical protein
MHFETPNLPRTRPVALENCVSCRIRLAERALGRRDLRPFNAAVQIGGGLLLANGKMPRWHPTLAFTSFRAAWAGICSGPSQTRNARPTNAAHS